MILVNMEAAPAAPSIDETSPAAGEERCVSLDEISDCAPRQDSQERRDVSSEDARGAVGGPKSPRWTADEDQRLSELVRAAPDRARPGMWDRIALSFPDRTASAVEHRWKDLNRDSEDARLTVGSDDAASDARSAVADDAAARPQAPLRPGRTVRDLSRAARRRAAVTGLLAPAPCRVCFGTGFARVSRVG